MKDRLIEQLRENFWVLVMDVIAINAAYMLTFFLRYYVHATFVPAAVRFVSAYARFAPFYTIICMAVFACFGLYNGMWRFATVNDMNRIIAANGVATLLHFIGTSVFTSRLPVNIYAIGASFQLLFTVVIRYAFRIIEMEKRKLANTRAGHRKVMVIGTGVNASNVIRYLSGDSLYKPVVAAGIGTTVRGLPVVQNVEKAVEDYAIDCIIVADPAFSDRKREALRRVCESNKIELHDYSGFLKNQGGALPLTELTQVIPGGAKVKFGDRMFDSVEAAMDELKGRYSVVEITGEALTIEIRENNVIAKDAPPAEVRVKARRWKRKGEN